jgi:hypothetical protein
MQRFFPILSALVPFAALLAYERAWPRRQRLAALITALLLAGGAWSALEAVKFLHRGFRVAAPAAHSRQLTSSRSAVLSVYSYAMLGSLPRDFSYGPMKPDLQLRLLDPESLEVIATNQDALLSGAIPQLRRNLRFSAVPGGAILEPDLQLRPGDTVLFLLDFKGAPVPGTLVMSGRDLWREYPLPESVSAYGEHNNNNHDAVIGLHIPETAGPESVAVRFVASAAATAAVVADLKVISYRSTDLPLQITSEIPYHLRVHAIEAGWLETPRIFIPGYAPVVAGKPSSAERSPDGLVMVRVPRGESEIELPYEGTPLLRFSFWVSLGAWGVVLLGWPIRRQLRKAVPAASMARCVHFVFRSTGGGPGKASPVMGMVGFCLATVLGVLTHGQEAREQTTAKTQRTFGVHIRAGPAGNSVELTRLDTAGINGRLVATLIDDRHLRLALLLADGTRSVSNPILVNFEAEQKIECGELPGGIRCVFFNHQLIWRSDPRH